MRNFCDGESQLPLLCFALWQEHKGPGMQNADTHLLVLLVVCFLHVPGFHIGFIDGKP